MRHVTCFKLKQNVKTVGNLKVGVHGRMEPDINASLWLRKKCVINMNRSLLLLYYLLFYINAHYL